MADGGLPREAPHRFTLLGRRLPNGLLVRLVVLEPEAERAYRSADWHGALVVIEDGAVTLITVHGRRLPLACGAVLWLEGLPLRAIANPHLAPALLSVLTRRKPAGGEEA